MVSALRSQTTGRRVETTAPVRPTPAMSGSLALADPMEQPTEPLPELQELRRRAPEDVVDAEDRGQDQDDPDHADADADDDVPGLDGGLAAPLHTSNVSLIIDATTDLSARAMQRVRQPPAAPSPLEPRTRPVETAPGQASPSPVAPAEVRQPAAHQDAVSHPDAKAANLEIGAQLRDAREWLGMSVDELADRTRIRPFVIESIEIGDFTPCGGDFYARGHLRMLTGVLGIEAAPIIASYDEHIATAPVSPRAVFDAELSRGVLRPTGGGSRWGALIGTVLVLLLVWGAARFFLGDSSHPNGAGAPSSSQSAAGTSPSITDPSLGGSVPPAVAPVHLSITATGSSRVVVWDSAKKIIYQGTLQSGQSAGVSGQAPLRVMAVDGGAVSVSAPGHPAAPMGPAGQRVFLHIG